MKLKFATVLLVIISAIGLLFGLAACSATENDAHVHYVIEHDGKAATCTETGWESYETCSRCDYTTYKAIPALGHEEVAHDGEAATCTEAGYKDYVTCSRCDYTTYEDIPALDHDWQTVQEIRSATCEGDGIRAVVCDRCGAREEEQNIPALGHDWAVTQIVSETCRHGGQYLHTCNRKDCGASHTTTTEPVGHEWDSGVTIAASCESEGSVTYTCTFGCGTQKVDKIKSLGHQWGSWIRTAEPDCITDGSEKHTCTKTGCGKTETRAVDKLGHIWSNDYIVDKQPSLEESGSKSKHCTRNGCNAKADVQTFPKLDADTPIEYTVTVKDPCGDTYLGAATIEIYADNGFSTTVPMATGGVTNITLGANNYKVRLSGLTAGYFTNDEQYDILATRPQLTVCLGAALRKTTSGVKYEVGSIMCDYTINYYDDPDGELKTSSFKDILTEYKGILVNFYFKGCQPCINEMPSLVAVSKAHPDILVLMVNDYMHGNSDDDIKYFQRTYANNSSLWFVNRAKSYSLYMNFYNGGLIGGFPTTVLIDCNGQVVYARTAGMSESSFNTVINTYILARYDKLHPNVPDTTAIMYVCEAILPPNKFQLGSPSI